MHLSELLSREQHSSSLLLLEAMFSVFTKTRKKLCKCNASSRLQNFCSDMAQVEGCLSVFLESVEKRNTWHEQSEELTKV